MLLFFVAVILFASLTVVSLALMFTARFYTGSYDFHGKRFFSALLLLISWACFWKLLLENPLRNMVRGAFSPSVAEQMGRADVTIGGEIPSGEVVCGATRHYTPLAISSGALSIEPFSAAVCTSGEKRLIRFIFPSSLTANEERIMVPVDDGTFNAMERMIAGGASARIVESSDLNLSGVTFSVADVGQIPALNRGLARWAFGGQPPARLFYIRYKSRDKKTFCLTLDIQSAQDLIRFLAQGGV